MRSWNDKNGNRLPSPPPDRMGILRTLLAIAVVFSHTGTDLLVGGQAAVQLFYVISGFLMSFVITEVRSYPSVRAFYVSRFLRLYPVYAVVALLTLFGYVTLGRDDFFATYAAAPTSAGIVLAISNVTLFFQDWVMFLGVRDGHLHFAKDFLISDPQLYRGLLAWQAWTLGLELTFYLIAPFLLPRRRWIWVALGLSLALRVVFILRGFGGIDPWTYRFFPTELALFLFGSLAHQLLAPRYRALPAASGKRLANWAVGGLVVYCVLYPWMPGPEYVRRLVLLAAFVVLVPLTFEFQRRVGWDDEIGKLSYPLYICHLLVLWLIQRLTGLTSGPVMTTAAVVCALLTAVVLDRYVGAKVEAIRARFKRTDRVPHAAA